jgi:hypothetical protein
MKLILEEIEAQTDASGAVQQFLWRKRLYAVRRVLESWRYNGGWWLDNELQGQLRHYHRVEACCVRVHRTGSRASDDATVCLEIFQENGLWVLSRLLD